jgi:hypothetical protein
MKIVSVKMTDTSLVIKKRSMVKIATREVGSYVHIQKEAFFTVS